MKTIFIVSIILLYCMPFSLFSQSSPLSKSLGSWINNPNSDLSDKLGKASGDDVKTKTECVLICQALSVVTSQLQRSFDETIENNIFNLAALFQRASTNEAANYLNDNGIPLLIDILSTIKSKQYASRSSNRSEPMLLKMFALYKNKEGLSILSECVNSNFKDDEYLWSVVLNAISEDESKYNLVIDGLGGTIPSGFLGIAYLDMCNSISMVNNTFKHPFNSEKGFAFLEQIANTDSAEHESYVVSATASIPFLEAKYQDKLLQSVSNHKSVDVQMEAAWGGAKIGRNHAVDKLIDFAKDYRYHSKAMSYLNELDLEDKVPNETRTSDFQALSEMCSWLSHPNEFGAYPDDAEVIYKKDLYWPPTKDNRTMFLVKYTYNNFNDDGSDEVGIGLVGSVTFSLFSLENMMALRPVELLAIHCSWELEKENYQDVKIGLQLLKKHNKDIE